MRAFVLHQIGDFQIEEAVVPKLDKGWVLVSVKAAGICGSDIPRIYRTGAYSYPLIPGHEFAGVVIRAGSDGESRWLGKRVGVFPLIPCGKCLPCQRKQYEMCRNYSYLGSRRDGGFAEFVAVPAENLIQLPDTVSFEEAAMLEPMAVAVHALRRAEPLTLSDTAVICGLGTIGTLLSAFLLDSFSRQESSNQKCINKCRERRIGRILAIGNKDFQKQTVLQMGILEDNYCDSRTQDVGQWLLERTDGMGADVFFECVGRNETAAQAAAYTAPGGRVVLAGNPYSDICLEKQVYWKILRNQLTISGTWNSSFTHEQTDDWHYVLDALVQGRIRPEQFISHRFPLEELQQGFHMMRDKTEDYIKIMCIM